ncbi:MAG TPA: recombinase family protein [Phycisphaerae bacterium]|nr:recombinase family protein [Phycisphaerae bacterium]
MKSFTTDCYLRRSSDDQPNSFKMQFEWFERTTKQMGIAVRARWNSFEDARRRGANESLSLRFDDAEFGDDLNRPGFVKFIEDAINDTTISHVFINKRDRFARPDDPVAAMVIERKLTEAGITIVFANRTIPASATGETDVASNIMSLIDYHESGNFLKQLAERVLLAQRGLAIRGYWNGGSAPYGFARALLKPNGDTEILEQGRRVQQDGCHVTIVPHEWHKIAVWIRILDLADMEWGNKRIATQLDKEGIPSPDAGKTRRDHGILHKVSGKWHPNTIKSLIENRAILGVLDYGRRSEGRHRRLDNDGIRPLDEDDRRVDRSVRTIRNDASRVISASLPYESLYDEEKWQRIQRERHQRGRSQRGIPRAKDLGRAPLSGRAIDLTDGCGHPMYSRQHGKRQILTCGRYMKTNASQCKSNSVDSEAAVTFVLSTLRQIIASHGGLVRIEESLRKRIRDDANSVAIDVYTKAVMELERAVAECESQISTAAYRLATVQEDLVSDVESVLKSLKTESKNLQRRLADERQKAPTAPTDPEHEIQAAMALLNQLETVTSDLPARREFAVLLRKLNLWLGLEFAEGVKGKKRRVQKLVGGVITFDENQLPVPPFGEDHVDDNGRGAIPPLEPQGKEKSGNRENPTQCGDMIGKKKARNVAGDSVESQIEGISITKVNRGERI